ncbi:MULTISPECIES: hypothetical protein [Chitinophagaceae]
MKQLILIFSLVLFSCGQKEKPKPEPKDFAEKVVDFTIANADTTEDRIIELPRLYDRLTDSIPEDGNEKLILAEILKTKGFEVTNWGRGNFPLGERVVSLTLKNDSCECRVDKMYYDTMEKGYYDIRESIQCRKLKH